MMEIKEEMTAQGHFQFQHSLMTYCFIEDASHATGPGFRGLTPSPGTLRRMTVLMCRVCFTVIFSDGHGPNSWQASASIWWWVISNVGELMAGLWLNTMIVIGSRPVILKHWAALEPSDEWKTVQIIQIRIILHNLKEASDLSLTYAEI